MNNEQLLILVTAWANRLEREITLLDLSLPDDLERNKKPVYTGNMPEFAPLDRNPAHWDMAPGDYVILDGLHDLLSELREAVDTLRGEK